MSSQDGLQEPLYQRLSASPEVAVTLDGRSKKRKRGNVVDEPKSKVAKKKKKKSSPDEDELDLDAGLNKAFSHMDSQLLADYVAQRTRKFESDLSSIELDDRFISAKAILDTTSFEAPRTLDNLPKFLEKFSSNPTKLWSASKRKGAPHTIIVAGAGLRAANLGRAIRKFQTKDSTVAKLFAKHIKLQDQVKFLKNNRTGMAVGTPARLNDLMEDSALAVDRLERIIVDASHIDEKKRGILEMKDTQVPLARWLNRKEFKERLGMSDNGIEILFY